MKRFLIALFLFSNPALAESFQGVQPENFAEWFHIGNSSGYGSVLCVQWAGAGDLTLERAKYYRDGSMRRYKREGARAAEIFVAGFNEGISSVQNLEEQLNKCEQLKIKTDRN